MPILDPLTRQIIGFRYRVANILGHGFVEKVYENSLAFELRRAQLPPGYRPGNLPADQLRQGQDRSPKAGHEPGQGDRGD